MYDSELTGEYLGWHSHNLRLANCKISGTQALCYAHDLVIENCTMADDADLCFEYSSVQADFDGLEKEASDPKVKLLLLCNPHNPAGRVWTRQELMRIGKICFRNDVWVVANEIHCELVFPGHFYTPFASVSKEFLMNSVTCISPSKAFNLAGLQKANIISANEYVRMKIDKAININEVCDVNPFGVEALIAAYNKGEEWLPIRAFYFLNIGF